MPMTVPSTVEIASCSDTGLIRDHNEDMIASDLSLGAMVLADGMGGYQAGEIASEIAVSQIMQTIHEQTATLDLDKIDPQSGYRHASLLLQQAVLKANQAIFNSAQADPNYQGMGTTVVCALLYDGLMSVAHVGDSRLYRLRDEQLSVVTTDHSVLQELIDHGFCTPEQARHSPNKNLVTRALGANYDVSVELTEVTTQIGDLYLLCSDGLNDMLEDAHISQLLQVNMDNLQNCAQTLINAANMAGGEDNISVILAQMSGFIEIKDKAAKQQKPNKEIKNDLTAWLRKLWR
jgi:protein phosphatase